MEQVETLKAEREVIESELKNAKSDMSKIITHCYFQEIDIKDIPCSVLKSKYIPRVLYRILPQNTFYIP